MDNSSSNTTEEWPELLAEFRFSPPDDQVAKLLKKKMEGKHSPINHNPWGDIFGITNLVVLLFRSFVKKLLQGKAIPEIDVYKFDAWDLPELLFPDSPYQAREWFAYSRPDYKYAHGSIRKRKTKHGFWKCTGQPRRINSESGTCFKRTVTFQERRVSKSENTGWVMQEYYFPETEAGCYANQQKRALVLCRLRRNKPAKKKADSKKLKDTLMCEELSDPSTDDDQAANAASAITCMTPDPDPEEHLSHKELDAQLLDDMIQERDFVLCRVRQKSDTKDTTICDEGELSNNNLQSYDDQTAAQEVRNMFLERFYYGAHKRLYENLIYTTLRALQSQYYSSSSLQSPIYKELGVVLQANDNNDDCTTMQSPFGDIYHYVIENNDISTSDEGDPDSFTMSDFQNEVVNDTFRELCAQLGINLDPPQLHVTQQSSTYTKMGDVMQVAATSNECLKWNSPNEDEHSHVTYRNNTSTYDESESLRYTASVTENQAADDMIIEWPYAQPVFNLAPDLHPIIPHHRHDYCSSTSQSPLYTSLGSVLHDNVYNDKCSTGKSPFCANISTICNDEQVENQATDERTSKVYLQPEDDLELLFHPPQEHDYTLLPLVNVTVGDALHGNNQIACDESHTPIWTWTI